jgi:excisionase family DNA binding protein
MSLLTVTDVANLLQVRPKRVRELIHDRHLAACNITPGGDRPTYRIDPEDLRDFQNDQKLVKPAALKRHRRAIDTTNVIQFFK